MTLTEKLSLANHGHAEHWFALVGSAFRTEAVDDRDGFTLLVVPQLGTETEAVDNEQVTPQQEYMLWEMTSSVDAR